MARSISKGVFVCESLIKKIAKYKEALKKNEYYAIKTYSRKSTIIPDMIGITIFIHNGKKFIKVIIKENMLGHKLGELAPTRSLKANHKIDPKKVKK